MKRAAGFAILWVAVGMVVNMLLPNLFIRILCVILCVLIGYELYSCS